MLVVALVSYTRSLGGTQQTTNIARNRGVWCLMALKIHALAMDTVRSRRSSARNWWCIRWRVLAMIWRWRKHQQRGQTSTTMAMTLSYQLLALLNTLKPSLSSPPAFCCGATTDARLKLTTPPHGQLPHQSYHRRIISSPHRQQTGLPFPPPTFSQFFDLLASSFYPPSSLLHLV